jgi:hypothetical protein
MEIFLLFCILFLNTWKGNVPVKKKMKLQSILSDYLMLLEQSGQYRNKVSLRSLKFCTFKRDKL